MFKWKAVEDNGRHKYYYNGHVVIAVKYSVNGFKLHTKVYSVREYEYIPEPEHRKPISTKQWNKIVKRCKRYLKECKRRYVIKLRLLNRKT
jgi:hypothetical protein